MVDEVIVPIRMRAGDFVIIWQIAQREQRSIDDFIHQALITHVNKLQEEWRKQQPQPSPVEAYPTKEPARTPPTVSSSEKGDEKK